jgi:hypothetical protein
MVCLATTRTPLAAAEPFAQTADDTWRLTFTLSGGIAGLNRQLVVEKGGAATAIDAHRNQQVHRQIAREDLSEIERLAASLASFEKTAADMCRDCLIYAIDLIVSGRTVRIRASDLTLSTSKASALVQTLTRVQQGLLAAP